MRSHSILSSSWIILIYHSLSVVCTVSNENLYSRFDRDAYEAASPSSSLLYHQKKGYYKWLRRKRSGSSTIPPDNNSHISYDDPNQCTTYLAPSSIPNSGLGMYTTIPYARGEKFPFPEIGVLLQDPLSHYKNPTPENPKLLTQYPWAAQVLTLGGHEVAYGESLVPGLGMLANSHLGLVNLHHADLWKVQSWLDGTDTIAVEGSKHSTIDGDVGRGASSWHSRVRFESTSPIQIGEELFV